MSEYSELLKDPRWQRRRLEIYQRENFRCENCGSTENTLTVHHVVYVRGHKPWEYRDELLQCFCLGCHHIRQELLRKITDAIQIAIKDVPTERLLKASQELIAQALEVAL